MEVDEKKEERRGGGGGALSKNNHTLLKRAEARRRSLFFLLLLLFQPLSTLGSIEVKEWQTVVVVVVVALKQRTLCKSCKLPLSASDSERRLVACPLSPSLPRSIRTMKWLLRAAARPPAHRHTHTHTAPKVTLNLAINLVRTFSQGAFFFFRLNL